MTIDEIKDLVDRQSFRPFTIRLAGGTSVPVNHRHAIAWADEESTTVHVVDARRYHIVALEHVVAIDGGGP